MNKKIVIATALSIILLLSACSSTKIAGNTPEDSKVPGSNVSDPVDDDAVKLETDNDAEESDTIDSGAINPPQGITVNIFHFEVLVDNIPEELTDLIEQNKEEKGYIAKEMDGVWYIAVLMGEKNTGGYDIEVESIEDNEGRTNIFVKEIVPEKDAMVTMAITYPYEVIKITDGLAPNFKVVNQDNVEYPEIK